VGGPSLRTVMLPRRTLAAFCAAEVRRAMVFAEREGGFSGSGGVVWVGGVGDSEVLGPVGERSVMEVERQYSLELGFGRSVL